MEKGICNKENFFSPSIISRENILTTHSRILKQIRKLSLTKKESRPIGFPISNELIKREK